MSQAHAARTFLPTPGRRESSLLGDVFRHEAVGGLVVLGAAVVAVLWANSPVREAYEAMRTFQLGPLDLEHWAADGALTLFFFVAGLELKRELVVGSLRRFSDALVPVAAAVAGVAVPALVYTVVALVGGGPLGGWAVPAATDIAFALAVLAVVGRSLPTALRAFLLSLAVVDDLIVIVIIAVFYTSSLHLLPLVGAMVLLAAYALLQQRRVRSAWIYLPLSVGAWWLVHESGVHATLAGVALGLLTRVKLDPGEHESPAERLEHRLTPLSAGVAVPFFALMAAGVTLTGGLSLLTQPVVLAIVLGLVVGKPAGVLLGAWTVTRLTHAELNPDITWRDVAGVAAVSGIGFTVALLVAELSFGGVGAVSADSAKSAVLLGSVVAALLAAAILGRRNRVHARAED